MASAIAHAPGNDGRDIHLARRRRERVEIQRTGQIRRPERRLSALGRQSDGRWDTVDAVGQRLAAAGDFAWPV